MAINVHIFKIRVLIMFIRIFKLILIVDKPMTEMNHHVRRDESVVHGDQGSEGRADGPGQQAEGPLRASVESTHIVSGFLSAFFTFPLDIFTAVFGLLLSPPPPPPPFLLPGAHREFFSGGGGGLTLRLYIIYA
jgi:hypothetical protein